MSLATTAAQPMLAQVAQQLLRPVFAGVARHAIPAAHRFAMHGGGGHRGLCTSKLVMAPWSNFSFDMPSKKLSFEIDSDGTAQVRTFDKTTGQASTAINVQSPMLKRWIEQQQLQVSRGKEAMGKQTPTELHETFEKLGAEVEAKIAEMSEAMSVADANRLAQQLSELRKVMPQKDVPRDHKIAMIADLQNLAKEAARKTWPHREAAQNSKNAELIQHAFQHAVHQPWVRALVDSMLAKKHTKSRCGHSHWHPKHHCGKSQWHPKSPWQ